MSPANTYLRFFSISPQSANREAKRLSRPPDVRHYALLAWLGDQLVGVASYEPTDKPGVAEIAFAVSDHMHGRGVATLLLDHLISTARLRAVRAFTAQTLADNVAHAAGVRERRPRGPTAVVGRSDRDHLPAAGGRGRPATAQLSRFGGHA